MVSACAPYSRAINRSNKPQRLEVQDAGIFGDVLCARMAQRSVAALVIDGVVRDLATTARV